jgi:hypothetical protein
MKALLKMGGIEDALDLADWLQTHDGERDVPAGADEAATWLGELDLSIVEHEIPAEHLPSLEWAVADWSEVLNAHHESFVTEIIKR